MFGSTSDFAETAFVIVAMLGVALLYQYVSFQLTEYFHWGEFIGTWMGMVCVWLYRTQNIHSWPTGIISVIALGWLFRDNGLPGQQWLNWGFFMAIALWGWPHWVFGGHKEEELPVTALNWTGRIMMLVVIAVGTMVVYSMIASFAPTSQYPVLDALVVASSVAAQFLLGAKKVESWWLWLGPVNIVSIFLFWFSGLYVVTALYVAFLIHAGFAIRTWNKELSNA